MSPRPIEILMVEDDPGDVRLFQEAMTHFKTPFHLRVVGDGEEALRFLRKKGAYETAATPDLLLLDLNLPRKSGREVFAELREDKHFDKMPIAVLTTSGNDQDLILGRDPRFNVYVMKPMQLSALNSAVERIEAFFKSSR